MSDMTDGNPDVEAARFQGASSAHAAAGATFVGNEPVLIFTAMDNEEADVVRATLAAAGIPAMLQSASVTTVMGAVDAVTRDTHNLGIVVAPSHVEAARALLNAPALTEEELAAEAAADPTTLAQAEAEVRKA